MGDRTPGNKYLNLNFVVLIIGVFVLTFARSSAYKNDVKVNDVNTPIARRSTALGDSPKTHTLENCGGLNDTFAITFLSFEPDPIPYKGDLYFTVYFTIREDIVDPLKIVINTEKKQLDGWTTVECSGYTGSCVFDNVCQMLDKLLVCPSQLMRQVPCRCPFLKGDYKIENSHQKMNLKAYTEGSYRTTIQMFHGDTSLACYKISYSIN